ncbi:hypothetical protein BKA62DRAFT_765343 [Auriculariales sp. MPI-PUGE-AT-0066]|nr:hypothetical protein BKA62DRAFT_765343 [Auriculariales sp. MPI-PUGE-AT-0066]
MRSASSASTASVSSPLGAQSLVPGLIKQQHSSLVRTTIRAIDIQTKNSAVFQHQVLRWQLNHTDLITAPPHAARTDGAGKISHVSSPVQLTRTQQWREDVFMATSLDSFNPEDKFQKLEFRARGELDEENKGEERRRGMPHRERSPAAPALPIDTSTRGADGLNRANMRPIGSLDPQTRISLEPAINIPFQEQEESTKQRSRRWKSVVGIVDPSPI